MADRVYEGRRWLALAACVVSACVVPDAIPTPPEQLPEPALALLRPDTVRSRRIDPGVVYRYVWSSRGPWAIHLVQAELGARCDLELGAVRALAREEGGAGRERVSSMVARSTERVIAAVNADFFTAEGETVGLEVTDGAVHAAAARPTVSWKPGRAPWIGTAEVGEDSWGGAWRARATP